MQQEKSDEAALDKMLHDMAMETIKELDDEDRDAALRARAILPLSAEEKARVNDEQAIFIGLTKPLREMLVMMAESNASPQALAINGAESTARVEALLVSANATLDVISILLCEISRRGQLHTTLTWPGIVTAVKSAQRMNDIRDAATENAKRKQSGEKAQ